MRRGHPLVLLLAVAGLAIGTAGCSARGGSDDAETREALTEQFCGGFAGGLCAEGQTCIDIPDDGCDPKDGGHDCLGVCGFAEPEPELKSCGGYAGALCAEDEMCVDDERDACDPDDGGSDCLGVCVPKPPEDEARRPRLRRAGLRATTPAARERLRPPSRPLPEALGRTSHGPERRRGR